MKFSSKLSIGMIALLAAASSSAGEIDANALNEFVSGTPALAAEVNENFDTVADAVNDNNDRINANTADIATNTAAITTNTADIAANATAITTNTADIATNTAAITTISTDTAANALAITANTAAIAANSDAIIDHTADIAANAAGIATNATDIAANTAAITANTDAIAALQQGGNAIGTPCAGNDAEDIMVRVGPLCVDRYEASVWSTPAGGTQYGVASDNFLCSDNGNDCSATAANAIYARSELGVTPSSFVTWFQALQACANSGKRLLTNAEWQMAAAGAPDPGAAGSDTPNQCNTNTAGKVAAGTSAGGSNQCVSNWGAFDMVGNVNEWVADWMQGNADAFATSGIGGVNSATYGSDSASRVQPASTQGSGANFPAAIYRGGAFGAGTSGGAFSFNAAVAPSFSAVNIGFRCAR